MTKKIHITEHQFKEFLNEKLGIAKKVVEISQEIEKKVYAFLDEEKNNTFFAIREDLNVCLKKLTYSSIEEFYLDYDVNPHIYKNGYSYNEKAIYLTFLIINNVLCGDNIKNTIQHEVEHYWQCKQSGKSLSTPQYQKIATLMLSDNPYISVISKLLYYSKKFEIDAQVNGAYNEIKTIIINITPNEVFQNTELGQLKKTLFDIKKAVESWDYESYAVMQALNTLNINEKIKHKRNKPLTKKKLITIINNTIDYFFKKTAKILALHIENIKSQNLNTIKENLKHNKITKTETFS